MTAFAHLQQLTDIELISTFQKLDKEQTEAELKGEKTPLRSIRMREMSLHTLYGRYSRVTASYVRKNEKFIKDSGSLDKCDIINEVQIALMLAAREFDVASGNAFMTFARFKITERVSAFVRQNSSQVKILTSAKSKKAKTAIIEMKRAGSTEEEMVATLVAEHRYKEYDARSFVNSILNGGRVEVSLQAGDRLGSDEVSFSIEDEIHQRGITSGTEFAKGEDVLVSAQRTGVLRQALSETFAGTHPALRAAFLKRFGIADDFDTAAANAPLSELDTIGTYGALAQDLAAHGFKGNGDCMTDENVRIIVQRLLDNVRSIIEDQGLQMEDLVA